MTEPRGGRPRQTTMKRTLLLTVAGAALGLALAGCGQQRPSDASSSSSSSASASSSGTPVTGTVGSCSADDAGVVHALPVYATFDLGHDGVGNALMVTRPDSTCPNILYTKVGGHLVSLPLKDTRLDLASARRVIVPGTGGDLMALREVHPRGGFQVHLYGYADGRLAEVTTPDGNPPVPFVATDTRGGYLSAGCTDQAIVVREAVAHQPPGVVFAWDVRQTTYRLDGTTATSTGTREIKDNVLDKALAGAYPDLVHRALFTSGCGG